MAYAPLGTMGLNKAWRVVLDAGFLRLDDYVTVLCHEEQEDDVITCIVQPARGCKDDFSNDEASTGRKKGCREVRLEALSGCKPRLVSVAPEYS
nr:hypothetical protein BaRGS_023422 [Batillaria attramentaria]